MQITSGDMPMLSDLQLVYMVPRNSTQLLKINTTKFQVEREPVYRTPWQETQVPGNILIPWETLIFWKNVSLPPPPAIKKKYLNLQENEKTSSFNHPKIALTIMKKPQTPHLKNSQCLKKTN